MPRLITLGGLSVQNGVLVNGVANPRSRLAILAVVAVAGDRGIRRERLAGLFWPDSDEERGRNALRQALFTLKRDIGAGDITLGVVDLRLNPDVLTADVIEFDAAMSSGRFEEAASLYQGPFLDGVSVRESPEFERWADEQRARLSAEYGRALEKAATMAAERGDSRAAADWGQRRSVHDPLSGRVAYFYMEALVAAGDREQAIRHASIHAALVRQELEAEPDADVLRLADRLRDATSPAQVSEGAATIPAQQRAITGTSTHAGTQHKPARPWFASRPVLAAALLLMASSSLLSFRLLAAKDPPVRPGLVALGSFESPSGDTALASLGDAVVTGIAQLLSQSRRAEVMDLRTAVIHAAGPNAESVAREFNVAARKNSAEFQVRGHVDRRADSLIVSAQVVVARTGAILFQVQPVFGFPDLRRAAIDEVRERIAGAIVAINDTTFPLWRDGRSQPPTYSAYLEFRQGLDALVNQGEVPAITHFRRAIELDPDFVQGKLLYLEQAVAVDSEKPRLDSIVTVLESRRASFVAYDQVAVDRQLAFIDGRLEDVYTAARAMLTLAPNSPDAKILLAQATLATRRFREAMDVLHSIGSGAAWLNDLNQRHSWDLIAHRLLGDLDAGIRELRAGFGARPSGGLCRQGILLLAADGREAEVDSLIASCDGLEGGGGAAPDQFLQLAGQSYRVNGHRAAADRAFRTAFAIRSDLVERGVRPKAALARLHIEFGEWQAAYDILMQKPLPALRLELAVAAANVGDRATAEEILRTFTARGQGGDQQERAIILLALGNRDSALKELEAAVIAGHSPTWNAWPIRTDLNPLRDDPRFQALVRPVR